MPLIPPQTQYFRIASLGYNRPSPPYNLLLNTTMTKVMWFGRKGSVPLPSRDITTLDGIILDQVTEYTYLSTHSMQTATPSPTISAGYSLRVKRVI